MAYSTHLLSPAEAASPAWAEAILELDRENMHGVLADAGLPFPEAERRRGLADESARVIVLLRGGDLAGYVHLVRDRDDPRDIYIGSIQLRRRHRGTTALGALLLAAIELLRTQQFRRLRTGVQANNAAAVRLYRHLGFSIEPRADTGRSLAVTADRVILESEPVRRLARSLARRWGAPDPR